MVAIGRALMSNPEVLLCDELSLGLAPVVIKDIYAAFPRIRETGAAIVIVEQDIAQALKVADRVYCMMEGRVTLEGRPAELDRADIHAALRRLTPRERACIVLRHYEDLTVPEIAARLGKPLLARRMVGGVWDA